MKALYENIDKHKQGASFVAYHSVVPYFEFKWHYHPEYELTLITKGEGKRLVGDSYESFETGDLVLLGSGLPHTWSSEPQRGGTSAVVIQFSSEFIGSFLRHAEFADIERLLSNASSGLFFPSVQNRNTVTLIKKLPSRTGIEKVMALLDILRQLSIQQPSALASEFFSPVKGKESEGRINKVFTYIQKQSADGLSLRKAAELVHLSDSAFCKFFKRVTGRTFSDYVNDIRTGNACRLLTETDRTIGEVAHASGFESLTYFNRVFLKKKGMTPGAFRKGIRQ